MSCDQRWLQPKNACAIPLQLLLLPLGNRQLAHLLRVFFLLFLLHATAQHSTAQHSTEQNRTAQHSTAAIGRPDSAEVTTNAQRT